MRLLLLAALALLLAPPHARATPLLGQLPLDDRVRLLDADLEPVPGAPTLPGSTSGTVLSPGGGRLAAYNRARGTLEIRDRRSLRVLRRVRVGAAWHVAWPRPGRIVTLGSSYAAQPNAVRIVDPLGGAVRATRLPGTILAADGDRVITRSGARYAPDPGDRYFLTRLGARRRELRVPPPLRGELVSFALDGDRVLASNRVGAALLRPHAVALDLPPDVYAWAGTDLVAGTGYVARVDLRTGAVRDSVEHGADGEATPFAGGVLLGAGRLRLDAGLAPVAGNASSPDVLPGRLRVIGGRVYAHTVPDCAAGDGAPAPPDPRAPGDGYAPGHPSAPGDDDAPPEPRAPAERVLVADARSGAVLRTVDGPLRFGALGGGELSRSGAAAFCAGTPQPWWCALR